MAARRDGSDDAPRYDLLSPAFHADPAPVLHEMRREDPVWWDGRLGAWVLTRYDDVAFSVTTPSLSVTRGGTISRNDDASVEAELRWCSEFVQRWMVFSDPPAHTRLRATAHAVFSKARMDALRPEVERLTAEVMARVSRDGAMDVMADVAVPVPGLVTNSLLGLPAADVGLLKAWTADMFALLGAGAATSEVVRRAHASMRSIESYFAEVIEDRRQRPADDCISALVARDGLTDDELVGLCVTLLAGAFETTAYLIGNGTLALIRHPHQLERLRRSPSTIPHAVEEIFRFDGPATSVVRTTRVDTPLPSGAVLPARSNVYCMLYAANRDPARFADPDVLDVERRDVAHLGLGRGVHFCLGAPLARLEAAAILRELVALDGLELDTDALAGGAPGYVPNLAIRGVGALPVRFRPSATQ